MELEQIRRISLVGFLEEALHDVEGSDYCVDYQSDCVAGAGDDFGQIGSLFFHSELSEIKGVSYLLFFYLFQIEM